MQEYNWNKYIWMNSKVLIDIDKSWYQQMIQMWIPLDDWEKWDIKKIYDFILKFSRINWKIGLQLWKFINLLLSIYFKLIDSLNMNLIFPDIASILRVFQSRKKIIKICSFSTTENNELIKSCYPELVVYKFNIGRVYIIW